MKVKDLVKQLEAYDGENELIVAYWDKEIISMYGGPDLTDDEWGEVVESYEDGEWHWQSSAAEDFVEIARNVHKEFIERTETDKG